MSEDPLAQLSGFAGPAPAVRDRQIVEDQQLSGSQIDGDLDVVKMKAVAFKKGELGKQAVKLQPAEKARLDLHAREEGPAPGCGALDDPCEAPLDVALVIVPSTVRSTIRREPIDQLRRWRPRALTQQCGQRHQPGQRLDSHDVNGHREGRIARNLLVDLRVQRQAEIEVQRLKIPGLPTVQGRDDKVSDD